MREQGLVEELTKFVEGAPPEVPAAVIAWLATDPAAQEWHGKTLHAQEVALRRGLVPDWRKKE
jgi:anti-sigma factor RsiW